MNIAKLHKRLVAYLALLLIAGVFAIKFSQ
jgi:hypothetical protein